MPTCPAEGMHDACILIVDDEAANVRFLEHALRPVGYTRIHGTTDPRRGEELFRELRPDLVLLDLMMPHLDGVDLLEQLQPLIAADDFLPVLFLSADASPQAVRRALAGGAHDYVTKPLRVHEVRLRIRNLLQTRALHLELRRQNRSLEERVEERTRALLARTRELEDARAEILARLGRASEYRDDATGEHTVRVGRLAGLLAAELGLPADEVELIERVAPLHDVGKIGIPDHVLLKPTVHSPGEFEVMKTHTLIGAELLGGSEHPILRRAETIALTHHETWDGTGYPHGLAGEAIPLAGRIVAVADVFDSLTHARPYKPAWAVSEALVEMRQQRGRQFDPDVVNALLRLHARGELPGAMHATREPILRLTGQIDEQRESEAPAAHTPEDRLALLEQERARLARRVKRLERALESRGGIAGGASSVA